MSFGNGRGMYGGPVLFDPPPGKIGLSPFVIRVLSEAGQGWPYTKLTTSLEFYWHGNGWRAILDVISAPQIGIVLIG